MNNVTKTLQRENKPTGAMHRLEEMKLWLVYILSFYLYCLVGWIHSCNISNSCRRTGMKCSGSMNFWHIWKRLNVGQPTS